MSKNQINKKLEEEPDYEAITKSIKKRSEGNWINAYDNLKQLWKNRLIDKNELENSLGELGVPKSGTLWMLKGFRRIDECSNFNKKRNEKTFIKIYPKK